MNKSEFKKYLKECVAELISEGAFDNKIEKLVESKIKSGKIMISENGVGGKPKPSREELTKMLVGNVVSPGSKFADIISQTASERLPEILNEQAAPNQIEEVEDQEQLNALAGGNMKRWAMAAFPKAKSRE